MLLWRRALRPANLGGLLGLAVALGSAGGAVVELTAGRAVSAAIVAVFGGVALYAAGTSFLGRPLRAMAVLLVGLLVVGGGGHALGVRAGGGGHRLQQDDTAETTVTGDHGASATAAESNAATESDDGSSPVDGHGDGCGGVPVPG